MSLFKKKKTQNYKNETQNYKEAQIIFFSHGGNPFHMWQDDVLTEYEKYKVPKTIENMWLNDIKESLLSKIKLSNNPEKLIFIGEYINLLDYASAANFLINTLDNYCGDTFSFILLIEELKNISHKVNNDLKEKIEAKIKIYKDIALNQEIVIDDYHKKLSYMKDYDFSPENIIKRINEI